ncbi:MAG: hypothetical protein KTR31_31350 [Myxococcales bacterium]|nr:hypothetical protein [Myxococcales bacterium]
MRWILVVFGGCSVVTPPDRPSYTYDVAPILQTHCVRCHTSDGRWDGGVELDRYETAASTAVRSACTALDPVVAERYGDLLLSVSATEGEAPCARWDVASMPPGALEHLSLMEQEIFGNWIATGMRP